jgi:hypothetical protein
MSLTNKDNTTETTDCKVVYSQPNSEQTDDLKIEYFSLEELENSDDYPIILLPKEKALLKLPRNGKSDVRGYVEDDFFEVLKSSNLNATVDNDKHIAVPGRFMPYEPDFVVYDKSINLYIDVEIDELYDGFSRIPTHTIEGTDDTRNLFFTESGWVVVRFTERQIHLNSKGCVEHLRQIIESLRDGTVKLKENVTHESRWDYRQAIKWERDLYREKYLGIQSFSYQVRNTKIICIDNGDIIDANIARTPKHLPSQNATDINTASISVNNAMPNIVFDEDSHTYFPKKDITGNSDYISVTTLIEKFFPYFDEEAYIKKRMSETGMSEDEIRKELQEPSERGTTMHEHIEAFLKGEPCKDNTKEFSLFLKFYNECIVPRDLKFYNAEMSVLLPENNIAGTVDALFKKSNGDFVMVDWKRSKHLIIDGYPKKYGFGRGLSVLSQLDNSSYYKYELQQSFYKYILEKKYHLHVSSMILTVLHPDYDNYYTIKLSDYREKEVKEMIEINDRMMK